MTVKQKFNSKIMNHKLSNNVYEAPSSQQLIEKQMVSYMNIFKSIADQISDLNNRIDDQVEAAE